MAGSYRALIGYQTSLTQQWLAMAVTIAQAYSSLLDPRPDLSVPARSTRNVYSWWW